MKYRKRRVKPVRVSYTGGYWKLGHVLEVLGYRNYQQYLESPLWNLIRREVLYRDEGECLSLWCKRRTRVLQVHHLDYSLPILQGLEPWELVTLCKDCHTGVEFSGRKKLNLYQSREKTLYVITGLTHYSRIQQWLKGWKVGNKTTLERLKNKPPP